MLEILALYFLCKEMGRILRKKGRKPLFMQIMVIVCWWGAMFVAAVAYGVFVASKDGPEAAEDLGVMVYVVALLGAAIGQLALFGIAHLLENNGPPPLAGLEKYDTDR